MPLLLRIFLALLVGFIAWWAWYIVGTLAVFVLTPFVTLWSMYLTFKETKP